MTTLPSPIPPGYPLRPVNGGPLPKAQPKHGNWYYEPKYNGWRAWVHAPTGAMFNRKLERLSIEREFSLAGKSLKHQWTGSVLAQTGCLWLDCEALERRHGIGQGSLFVLDAPIPGLDYGGRRDLLLKTFGGPLGFSYRPCANHVHTAPAVRPDAWETLQFLNQEWKCEFYEGLVAKRADSLYPLQLRSAGTEFPYWMKHRWAF